jgi:hypothetical protein
MLWLHAQRISRLAKIVCATVALTACQQITLVKDQLVMGFTTYSEPSASEANATIRIVSDGDVSLYPNSACTSSRVPGAGFVVVRDRISVGAQGLNGQKRGVPGVAPAGFVFSEVRAPAGVPLTIGYTTDWQDGRKLWVCHRNMTFVPEPGASYEIRAIALRAATACAVSALKLGIEPLNVKLVGASRCDA